MASDIPTLVLAGTYDAQTPIAWNKQAFVHLPNAFFGRSWILPTDPIGVDATPVATPAA